MDFLPVGLLIGMFMGMAAAVLTFSVDLMFGTAWMTGELAFGMVLFGGVATPIVLGAFLIVMDIVGSSR